MTDAALESGETAPPVKKPSGKKPLIFGILGALILGGGGFFAVYSGLLDSKGGGEEAAHDPHAAVEAVLQQVSFVPIEQIVISLPREASARNLRFTGELEVAPGQAEAVAALMPRILDVLNTYLRAVDAGQRPRALPRPRASAPRCCGASRSSRAMAWCGICSSPNSFSTEEAAQWNC